MPYIEQVSRSDVTIWQVQSQLTERNIKYKKSAQIILHSCLEHVYVPLIFIFIFKLHILNPHFPTLLD